MEPVPLITTQKTVVGLKNNRLKKKTKKKQNEIIINFMALFMDGFQLPQG